MPRVYDPLVASEIVARQEYDLRTFLEAVDLIVIMVKHKEVIQDASALDGKVILDCHHIMSGNNVYYL